MARLTLEIPDEAHRKLKTLAASSGLSMKELILSRTLAPASVPESAPYTLGQLENVLSKIFADNRDILRAALEASAVPVESPPEVSNPLNEEKLEAKKTLEPKYVRLQLRPEFPKPLVISTISLDKAKIAKLHPAPSK